MLFICYSGCSTCQKAERWLKENGVDYDVRDIKSDNPTESELRKWHADSGLPLKRFFNTSGILYRELGLKNRLPNMSDDEMLALLAADGMLVKRPIAVSDDRVLVGFKENEWNELLK